MVGSLHLVWGERTSCHLWACSLEWQALELLLESCCTIQQGGKKLIYITPFVAVNGEIYPLSRLHFPDDVHLKYTKWFMKKWA